MRTYLDCIPCFFKQALEAARLAGADQAAQKKILDEVSKLVPGFPLQSSPPEMGRSIYRLVRQITGKNDPYKQIKKKSNRMALNLYPRLKRKIENSTDRLLAAVELAIAGNVIDYSVKNTLSIENELRNLFATGSYLNRKRNRATFDYQEFKAALKKAKMVLYLADNAGETVFDRVLIEELNQPNYGTTEREIVYAVRSKPIINDALLEDALACGIDKYARIISSGSDAPGTPLKYCSATFLRIYETADLIISKGQGNFETLVGEDKPIYFLFRVKCPVIAKDIGCSVGGTVLKALNKDSPSHHPKE